MLHKGRYLPYATVTSVLDHGFDNAGRSFEETKTYIKISAYQVGHIWPILKKNKQHNEERELREDSTQMRMHDHFLVFVGFFFSWQSIFYGFGRSGADVSLV